MSTKPRLRGTCSSLTFLALLYHAHGACLPEALAEGRINLTDPLGSTPIGITPGGWATSYLTSALFQILTSEVLGFNAVVGDAMDSSMGQYYAVAGCGDPNNWVVDAKCAGQQFTRQHVTIEMWYTTWAAQVALHVAKFPDAPPILAGDMGYEGSESIFVTANVQAEAMNDDGLPLEFYKSYNTSWHQAWRYFNRIQDIDTSTLKTCSQSQLMTNFTIANYAIQTGDMDGVVVQSDGSYIAKCWNNVWWLAPACRQNSSQCIPLLTGGNGWHLDAMMQKATFYGWPAAIAVAANWSMYVAGPTQYKVLTYWYTPDNTFLTLGATPLFFPPNSKSEWARGLKATTSTSVELVKFASPALATQAPRVLRMLKSMQLELPQIHSMLLDQLNSGDSDSAVACRWLLANRAVWQPWVPDETSCDMGWGLVNQLQAYVTNRAAARSCAWCLPGSFSDGLQDSKGTTRICTLCPTGSAQGLPGSSSCDSCSLGTFTANTGQTICQLCPKGTYQALKSQSNCTACPSEMTTLGDASISPSDCVCPSGSLRPCFNLSGQLRAECRCPSSMYFAPRTSSARCLPCPAGMVCPAGSDEANMPCSLAEVLNSTRPYPLPIPGYQTLWAAPFKVYQCLNAPTCPGGGINSCSNNMRGPACGSCIPGYYRKDDQCWQCDSVMKSRFLFPALPLLVGPLVLVVLYRFSQDPVEKWGSPMNSLSCILYLSLVFVQVLGTIRTCYLVLPGLVQDALSFTGYSTSLFSLLRPDCADFVDFRVDFIGRILIPLYPLVIFLATYLVSQATRWQMRRDMVQNIYGSIYYTFFVGIAAQCFSLFQVYKHPCGEWSMRSEPAILTSSQDWKDLVAVSVTAIVVFCGGALALFCYTIVQAPKLFKEETFRVRWKFLLIKFRPTTYWWSLVLLLKGVWLSLATVIFNNGQDQTLWLTCGLITYLVGCFALMPWRSYVAAVLDIGMHVLIALICSVLLAFVPSSEVNSSSAAAFLTAMAILALIMACAAALYLIWMRFHPSSELDEEREAVAMCAAFAEVEDPKVLRGVLRAMPAADVQTLKTAAEIILNEIFAEQSKDPFQMRRLLSRSDPLMKKVKQHIRAVSLESLGAESPPLSEDSSPAQRPALRSMVSFMSSPSLSEAAESVKARLEAPLPCPDASAPTSSVTVRIPLGSSIIAAPQHSPIPSPRLEEFV